VTLTRTVPKAYRRCWFGLHMYSSTQNAEECNDDHSGAEEPGHGIYQAPCMTYPYGAQASRGPVPQTARNVLVSATVEFLRYHEPLVARKQSPS